MRIESCRRVVATLGLTSLALCLLACSAPAQGLNSRQFDNLPAASTGDAKAEPALADAPTFDLALSVKDAYAAIPHRRTVMDFNASDMPAQDKRYLTVAFNLIDQAIRLRVSAQQKFARGGASDTQLIADMNRIIDYLQHTSAPAGLTSYQEQLVQALCDQRDFFAAWHAQRAQFSYGSPDRLGAHPKVQSASSALRDAYEILMRKYPGEDNHNRDAFFDYHCALDFL
jgi:hypothetical protein